MVFNSHKSGFALLVSLVVVGSVLSIGLVILDLSIKQVRLSATTKDSEVSFHAANAGMECARYWRRQASAVMEAGDPLTANCFGDSDSAAVADITSSSNVSGDGNAFIYEYELTWNANERCSSITTIVAVADLGGGGLNITDVDDFIPGYPTTDPFDCAAGGRCTVAAVQGYNNE